MTEQLPKNKTRIEDLDNTGTLFDPNYFKPEGSTEAQIEKYDQAVERAVDTQNLSYDEAERKYAYLLPNDSEPQQSAEVEPREGVSIDLGKRALHLLGALDEYSKASRLDGFTTAIQYDQSIQRRYSPTQQDDIISTMNPAQRRGDKSFDAVSGADELKAAGFDPDMVDRETARSRQEFQAQNVGAGNRSNREKLRRRLKKQI